MIDTHVHLDHDLYGNEKPDISELKLVIQICTDTTLKKVDYPNVKYSIGIHPVDVKKYSVEDLKTLQNSINDSEDIVAVGEIGLDYHWYPEEHLKQKLFFEKQLHIAIKYKLPVIIHAREAYQDLICILKKNEFCSVKGVVHSFSGSEEEAHELITLGFFLGITGPITFKNGENQRKVVEKVDLNNLLAETDSPFLTPVPNRGRTNEPSNVKYVVAKIAELKNMSFEKCEKRLDENANLLFGLEKKNEFET